ncbi:MAG TPA: DUF4956 domain-containing protein [Christensenellaceae bacterium]|jgi:uncharacterized membrane protein YhiD involved in acid resistance|nr:DUF4956 domain-containing protein [Christensenellaceae bacterium]
MITLAHAAQQAAPSKKALATSDFWISQFAQFTPKDIALVLLFSLIASVIISLVYKKTYRGVLYNPSFGVTLILLTMITSSVVMAIGSNVALSMGMVGALSIVRFRTAVKDPIDTAYMFWSITMGILIGTRYYLPAMVVVLGISFVMLMISFLKLRTNYSYLLVMHYDPAFEQEIMIMLSRVLRNYRLRSKTVTRAGAEMTVELQLRDSSDIVGHMLGTNGVYDATLVSCQSEAAI